MNRRVILAVVAVSLGAGLAVAGAVGAFASSSTSPNARAKASAASASSVPVLRTSPDAVAFLSAHEAALTRIAPLTASDIAQTRVVFTFPTGGSGFSAGQAVFQTPLAAGGYCLTFAGDVSCTKGFTPDVPVAGIATDPDGPTTGQPFVLVAIKQPDVSSVTYTCRGQAYTATISGDVLTFVAPSAALDPSDCTETATLANGRVVTHVL